MIGTVVDNADPMEQGQVKVMFPWLAPDYISAWCRVMQIGASKIGGGFLWIPEIGDEVLIGFDRGSIDHPFVIGNLYNGIASPLPPPSVAGVVANRRIASRMAHTIQWNDGPEAMGISIMTAPVEAPPTSVVLDGEEIKITINSLGQVQITGAVGVSISSEAQLSLERPRHQHRQRGDRLGQRGRTLGLGRRPDHGIGVGREAQHGRGGRERGHDQPRPRVDRHGGELRRAGLAVPARYRRLGQHRPHRDDRDLDQAMRLILATAKGERPMRPDFGCGIHDYVFAPADATTAGRLAVEVQAVAGVLGAARST